MRRHQECADENEIYPMKMNGKGAVMVCRHLFSFVSQKG